jgi:YopX protein
MEYEFKTVYRGKLIPCIHDQWKNAIYIHDSEIGIDFIGHLYKEPGQIDPVFPVFQYTGKKDINGEEIYCGHLLKKRIYQDYERDIILLVIWNEKHGCYELKSISEDAYYAFPEVKGMEIIGHEALENK